MMRKDSSMYHNLTPPKKLYKDIIVIHDKSHTMTNNRPGYIYIIQEREFVNTNENVYKIGRTENIIRRFSDYPKGSKLFLSFLVSDMYEIENEIKEQLCKTIKCRRDIGTEYYEGEINEVTKEVLSVISKYSILPQANQSVLSKAKIKDPELLIIDYINLHKDEYFGKTKKTLDVYQAYLDWCETNQDITPAKYVSHKEFTTIIKNNFSVECKPCRLAEGVYQCIIFAAGDPIDEVDEAKLKEFLTSDRFVKYKKDAMLLVKDFKSIYMKFTKVKSCNMEQIDVILQESGYEIKHTHMCKSCGCEARSGCCVNYNRNNRVKRYIIKHMEKVNVNA